MFENSFSSLFWEYYQLFLIFWIVLCISIVVSAIIYARWNYGILEKLNIPIIKPTFCLGSVPNLHLRVQHLEDIERFKKFGPVWGLYQGRSPLIYVCDPDVIRRVFVKDTEHFPHRNSIDFGDPVMNEILDLVNGEKAKLIRVSQTKLFSTGKIKQAVENNFNPCATQLVERLKKRMGSENFIETELRDEYLTFAVNVISLTTFSVNIDTENNTALYKALKHFVGEDQHMGPIFPLSMVFPILSRFTPTHPLDHFIVDQFYKILDARFKQRQQNPDLSKGVNDMADVIFECLPLVDTDEAYKRLKITKRTLVAQAINLYLAGMDRICSIMVFFCYEMGKNLDFQKRLHEEIDEFCKKHEGENLDKITDEMGTELKFLTAAIKETLRLYPTEIRPERYCAKEWHYPEKGLTVPKGVNVLIPTWPANRHPDYFTDPHDFKPERYMTENGEPTDKGVNNPYTFSTFGHGHRNCIGIRYSYSSLRIALFHLFRHFEFLFCPKTELKFKPGIVMLLQFFPLYMKIQKRSTV